MSLACTSGLARSRRFSHTLAEMGRIRAILFDLGGTLWHIPTMPPLEQVRAETVRRITQRLERWGYPLDSHAFMLGRNIRLAVEAAERAAYEGDCVSPDYIAIVKRVAVEKGFPLSDAQAGELWEAWNLGGAFFGRHLYDDTLPTLRWLKDRGYRLGIVTNRAFSGSHFQAELAASGLRDHFDVLAVSCDVGYMKPHPALFRYALNGLDVAPDAAVHIGDSLIADVAGAHRLGICAIWRRGHLREEADGIRPDYIIDNLAELLQLPIFQADP